MVLFCGKCSLCFSLLLYSTFFFLFGFLILFPYSCIVLIFQNKRFYDEHNFLQKKKEKKKTYCNYDIVCELMVFDGVYLIL